MAGTPDLFVVCKKCGSEVSPYITECPYCGTRLRKRAPKIIRPGDRPSPRSGRFPRPSLPPLRSGELPGISADPLRKPWATALLVAASLIGYLVIVYVRPAQVALATLDEELWRLVVAPFIYPSVWYQLAVLVPLGLFGWRLELRHGPLLVLALFIACGIGGIAISAAVAPGTDLLGAPGAALGMLAAWALPDLLRARRGLDHDADLLGVLVMAVLVAAMPLATPYAGWIATGAGLLIGACGGLMLLRTDGARR
jgi:membrane associated rhomboid family serine protease